MLLKLERHNPFEEAASTINQIRQELADISLEETELPFIENPLLPTAAENTITGPNTFKFTWCRSTNFSRIGAK